MRIALVFVLAGCGLGDVLTGGTQCTQTIDADLDIAPTTPQLQLVIESCRVDVDACPVLCTTAMSVKNIAGSFQHCNVTFDGSTAKLAVTYEIQNAGANCPEDDEPGPTEGF